jgi:hypothetical protein
MSEYLVVRIKKILSYTGSPSDWQTLELKVTRKDGDLRYPLYPETNPTVAFRDFQKLHQEFSTVRRLT